MNLICISIYYIMFNILIMLIYILNMFCIKLMLLHMDILLTPKILLFAKKGIQMWNKSLQMDPNEHKNIPDHYICQMGSKKLWKKIENHEKSTRFVKLFIRKQHWFWVVPNWSMAANGHILIYIDGKWFVMMKLMLDIVNCRYERTKELVRAVLEGWIPRDTLLT